MERKVALSLVVVHTGTCQLKIIWNLIQENSDDNFEFSSAEKRALNTHTHTGHYSFTVKKIQAFSLPYGFSYRGTWVQYIIYYNPLAT